MAELTTADVLRAAQELIRDPATADHATVMRMFDLAIERVEGGE